MALIQEGVNTEANENFGIKIVDVRIKRATFLKQTVTLFLEECRLKGKEKQRV